MHAERAVSEQRLQQRTWTRGRAVDALLPGLLCECELGGLLGCLQRRGMLLFPVCGYACGWVPSFRELTSD